MVLKMHDKRVFIFHEQVFPQTLKFNDVIWRYFHRWPHWKLSCHCATSSEVNNEKLDNMTTFLFQWRAPPDQGGMISNANTFYFSEEKKTPACEG